MSMIFLPDRQPFGAAIDAAIMVHANANPRTEICGVVTAAAGGTGWVYHRLANVAADPATVFLIDPSDLSALPPPAAIIHSHPHGPAWPSAHDMQQAMAGACVWGIALPTWLHQKAPDMPGAGEVFWFGDAVMPSLDRRGYRHGVSDCYALVRDWYRLHHSITLIDRPREWNWWQEGGDLFDAHFALSGFERHPAEITPQAGDVALANILSPMVNHALIYLGDGLVLHHPAGRAGYEPGRLPRREPRAAGPVAAVSALLGASPENGRKKQQRGCGSMSPKYRYLWLHGSLATFGVRHRLMVNRPREMINALVVQRPGFEAALRRGRFAVFAGPKSRWHAIDGVAMDEPIDETQLHLVPEFSGHGRVEGKMLLGLTLLGLSFVPGVQAGLTSGFSSIGESLAGASGAELGGMLGSRLLGGAGTWLMMAGASEALAPQLRQPAGDPSGIISGPQPTGEGAAVPLVYGRARVEAPPIISAGVTVRTMVP